MTTKTKKVDGYEIEDIKVYFANGRLTTCCSPTTHFDYNAKMRVQDPGFTFENNAVYNLTLTPETIGRRAKQRHITLFDEINKRKVYMLDNDFLLSIEKYGVHDNHITGAFAFRRESGIYLAPVFRN
jgi:hypothetical protein